MWRAMQPPAVRASPAGFLLRFKGSYLCHAHLLRNVTWPAAHAQDLTAAFRGRLFKRREDKHSQRTLQATH